MKIQKKDLKIGEYYCGDEDVLFLCEINESPQGKGIRKSTKSFATNNYFSASSFRKSSEEEIQWVNSCIRNNNFISKEEALKSKTKNVEDLCYPDVVHCSNKEEFTVLCGHLTTSREYNPSNSYILIGNDKDIGSAWNQAYGHDYNDYEFSDIIFPTKEKLKDGDYIKATNNYNKYYKEGIIYKVLDSKMGVVVCNIKSHYPAGHRLYVTFENARGCAKYIPSTKEEYDKQAMKENKEWWKELKKGDFVVCILNSGYGYKKDWIFEIKSIGSSQIYTKLDCQDSDTNGWKTENFRPATEQEIALCKTHGHPIHIDTPFPEEKDSKEEELLSMAKSIYPKGTIFKSFVGKEEISTGNFKIDYGFNRELVAQVSETSTAVYNSAKQWAEIISLSETSSRPTSWEIQVPIITVYSGGDYLAGIDPTESPRKTKNILLLGEFEPIVISEYKECSINNLI